MEYQKIINFLGNTSNQISKFRTKNWVEINDKSHGQYNTTQHAILLKSNLKIQC